MEAVLFAFEKSSFFNLLAIFAIVLPTSVTFHVRFWRYHLFTTTLVKSTPRCWHHQRWHQAPKKLKVGSLRAIINQAPRQLDR